MQECGVQTKPELNSKQRRLPALGSGSGSGKIDGARAWLWIRRSQFVVLTTIATYLSLVPKPGAVFEASPDKFLHLLCWGVLLVSLWLACGVKGFRMWMVPALFGYSVLVEIGQIWVPNRYFSFADIIANGAGILLGTLAVWLCWVVTRKNHV